MMLAEPAGRREPAQPLGAHQQKELLEQQAATIQAGTEKVLAAQNAMIESMELKQKENQKDSDSRVRELMERLAEVEMALRREKVKCLEFEAALVIECQNKRRAVGSPEEARGGKARSTAPSQHRDADPTPGVSASGLPISRKFNLPLLSSVRSKDRQPSQEIIGAMMASPPIPSIQIQPMIQPIQPVIQPTISTCNSTCKSTTSGASRIAIQPSHHLLKDCHKRSRIPPLRGARQSIGGCLEEKAARTRMVPAGIWDTQRGHARVLFEAALFGVEEPLLLVGESPK